MIRQSSAPVLACALILALAVPSGAEAQTGILRKKDNSAAYTAMTEDQGAALQAAIGQAGDNMWGGSGPGSQIAILKYLAAELASTLSVAVQSSALPSGAASGSKQDAGNTSLASIAASAAPYATPTAMTVGTTYAAGRAVAMYCTASGDVALTLSSGGTLTLPVNGGTGGLLTVVPIAATKVNSSGTTATCAFTNLS